VLTRPCIAVLTHPCIAVLTHPCIAVLTHPCIAVLTHPCIAVLTHPCIAVLTHPRIAVLTHEAPGAKTAQPDGFAVPLAATPPVTRRHAHPTAIRGIVAAQSVSAMGAMRAPFAAAAAMRATVAANFAERGIAIIACIADTIAPQDDQRMRAIARRGPG
jgi:hypothetical protein